MLLQEEKHFLFNGLFTSFNNVLFSYSKNRISCGKNPYLALEGLLKFLYVVEMRWWHCGLCCN